MKRGTEVFQSESRGELQVSLGDKYEDTGEPDQPSPSLLRKNGLELETCEVKTSLTRILLLTVPDALTAAHRFI